MKRPQHYQYMRQKIKALTQKLENCLPYVLHEIWHGIDTHTKFKQDFMKFIVLYRAIVYIH